MYLIAKVNNLRNQKYLNAFGENLKRLRNAKGMSQEKLALATEVDYQQIYRIEHGKINTTISTILSIARALNVHPKELLNFDFKD
jgi:transcriptional regulator with XRE-family HTH domain